jgi:hypothetical protein
MKKYLLASLLIAGMVSPTLAAREMNAQAPTKHFAVKDTVGVCSVIDVQPSRANDMKILGSKNGYGSVKDAMNALGSAGCKDKIQRG